MSTFIVYFGIEAFEEDLKKKNDLTQKHFIEKKRPVYNVFDLSLFEKSSC